jgi:four helix bundle protein
MERKNEIVEISFEFALNIIAYSELLEENKKFVIARQILRSGTSIGANVRESQGAESKADFVHKLKIAHKEAEETGYWLLLCEKAPTYPSPSDQMKAALLSIQKLLSKIISSSKK